MAVSLDQPPFNRWVYNSMSSWYHIKLYITYSNTVSEAECISVIQGALVKALLDRLSFVLENNIFFFILWMALPSIRLLACPILSAIRSRPHHQLSGRSLDLLFEAILHIWLCLLPFLSKLYFSSSRLIIFLLLTCFLSVAITNKKL